MYQMIFRSSTMCVAAIAAIVASGMVGATQPSYASIVAEYGFDGSLSDSSGHGLTAEDANATYTTGVFGNAVTTTSSSYIQVPPVATTGGQAWTMSLWVNTTSDVSSSTYWQNPTLAGIATDGAASGDVQLQIHGGYVGFSNGLYGSSDYSYYSSTKINDGVWHLVTLTSNYTGTGTGALSLYVDGAQLSTDSSQSYVNKAICSDGLGIGGVHNSAYGTQYATGSYDDVSIWSDALSSGEVAAMYNVTKVNGLTSYDAGVMEKLFEVYDGTLSSYVDGTATWTKVTGLTGHTVGDVWSLNGAYYMQLDSSGVGVRAIPEPGTCVLLGAAAISLIAYAWRRRKS